MENDQEITIPNNWKPRPKQLKLWRYLESGGKRAVAFWHRRFGKDDVALHWAAAAMTQRPGTYWHLLPEAAQARKAIWDAINPKTGIRRIDEAFPREIWDIRREHEMLLKSTALNATWQVLGSDNFNSLVGSPPIGVVFSEWALADPSAWAYIRPILAENGGWALFISTPRGKNHGYRTYKLAQSEPGWFAEILTVDDTKAIPQDILDAELREYVKEYGPEQGKSFFEQEYYCSFNAAILGAVYGAAMARAVKQGRVGNFKYDPELPVNTAWDLGRTDSSVCIWWQQAKNEIRVIKSNAASFADPEDLVSWLYGRQVVVDERDNKSGRVSKWHLGDWIPGFEECSNYKYNTHYVPHDAAIKLLQASGRSIIEQFHDLGVKTRLVAATSDTNSHTAARTTIERTWFNEEDEKLVEALSQYHYLWDSEKKEPSIKPVHDWTSHYADAYEIIGQVWRNPVISEEDEKPRFLNDLTAKDVFWPEKTENKAERY